MHLFTGGQSGTGPTVEKVVGRFDHHARSLLQDVEVEYRINVRVDTTTGSLLSANVLARAYEEILRRKQQLDEEEKSKVAQKGSRASA